MRSAQGPFRGALLAIAVCNTPDAHKLAAQGQPAGGWPVMLAIASAKQAGQDWHTAVAAIRHRLAQDAIRQRAGHALRLEPEADLGRLDGETDGAR